ncbi:hypothetical protein Q0Z83_059980 [Actinoplanes sichuanensis]|uniref:Holin n=1 Tax=Actinoplanes sichuanensis TaxID=512349 RepID=A0ABW4A6G5_9ACTN|nr:hypothetical protein [Actinoplanes sichuanensis]BEL07807.1 hypothetical protein Q0Z83_059980 [Actinoplanes sichuanensis]
MYGKAIVAILTAGIVAAYQALSGDQTIEPAEWVSVAIAIVTAVGVWLVPLAPGAAWAKTAVAVVLAVLQVLTTAILDGLGTDEILLMLITAAGAAGIWIAPAESTTGVSVGVGADR